MKTQMNLTAFALLAVLLTASASAVEKTSTEVRTHYALEDRNGVIVAEATEIYRIADRWDGFVVLYRSRAGDDLVLEQRIDYASKTFELTIRDVAGEDWVKASSIVPYVADTSAEALAASFEQKLKLIETSTYFVTFETAGGARWEGFEKDWVGAARTELVRQLRRSVPFELLETIERTRATLFQSGDLSIGSGFIVEHLTYEPVCEYAPPTVRAARPDCDFDRSFGFACSVRQAADAERGDESTDRY